MIRIAALLAGAVLTIAAAPVPLASMWENTAAAARKGDLHGHLIVADATSVHGEDVGNSTGPALWRWASVSKQIIAVLVMQEVDRGRVTLDTPIRTYAPQLQVANADKVTLRQLLQHTSGLPNVEDGPMNTAGTTLALFDRSSPAPGPGINAICRGPAKAEPGARFEYNDCDTEVAGAVLEAVTGLPLDKLLSERLFVPLGMTGARLLNPGDDAGRPGLLPDGKSDDFIDVGRFGAAGAIAGPPAALARFDKALLAGQLMTPASRAEMWKGNPEYGFAALGQWVYTVPLAGCAEPVELVERRGSIGGIEIRNVIAPAKGRIVIAFADRPADFGEPWQGKGLTYDLLSAALCKAE